MQLFIGIAALFLGMLISFCLTLWLVPKLIALARQKGVLDVPDDRRIHQTAVPRLGGLAIFLASLTGLSIQHYMLFISQGSTFLFTELYIVPAILIIILGLVDDLYGTRALVKLAAQISIAILLFSQGVQVHSVAGFDLPFVLNLLLTITWIVLITNAFNLIDGFDGVASGLCIVSAIGISGSLVFRGLYFEAAFLLPLIGACSAFLRFNRSPASIFLGDSGSLFIGFTLAWISLVTVSKGPALASIWVPFLALGVPLFDLLLAVWRRLVRRFFHKVLSRPLPAGIMAPDLDHIHHRLNNFGLAPHNVAAALYLLNCFLVFLGIALLTLRQIDLGTYAIFFIGTAFLMIRYLAKIEIKESRVVLRHGFETSIEFVKQLAIFSIIELIGLSIILYISVFGTYYWIYPPNRILAIWQINIPAWVFLPAIGSIGLGLYYKVRGYSLEHARLMVVDLLFVVALLAIVAAVVTRGYSVDRIIASYYFPLSFLYLMSMRILRFKYFTY